MNRNCTFAEIGDAVRQGRTFLVMSHFRPDGDAIGSAVAFGLYLQGLGKDVTIWNQDPVPEKFRFLPGADLVQPPPQDAPRDFDIAVSIDTAVQERVGTSAAAIRHAGTWINIDHHVSNNHYGDLAYIDPLAPAAGEVLAEYFAHQHFPITAEMAANLYTAISTDTGSFQYPNTTARTYEIAAGLIKAGANVGDLSQRLYESYPRRRLELLAAVLNGMRFSEGGRIAAFGLKLETVLQIGSKPEDTEGLIDYLRAVEGVVIAAFFEEQPEGKVRISLRSKDPRADVCKVCQTFGGGGHILASGARASGTLEEVMERVLSRAAEEF